VYSTGGRTVAVQPRVQIVERMVACVTRGLSTPGVRTGSASTAAGPPPRLKRSASAASATTTAAATSNRVTQSCVVM